MPSWDDPDLRVASDSARMARYRRLQSWYREVQLGVEGVGDGANGRPVASMLPTDAVSTQPSLNFLTPAAARHAQRRIQEVQDEGGTLEVDRLRRNLLSSMPLCFNLFGSLGTHPAFAALVRDLVDDDLDRIEDVVCEWAPRPASEFLNDRSAFDAFVSYEHRRGSRCFVGVETKYTEPFSPTAYSRPEYQAIAETSGWFTDGSTDVLSGSATNQLWRTLLLAAALEERGSFERGTVLLLTTDDDTRAVECVQAIREHLVDPSRLVHVTFERLVDRCRALGDSELGSWANAFQLRYLNPESLDHREPDTTGPRLGKPLAAPERTFEPDHLPGPRLTEALSWSIASRLARRHPGLRIVEDHPAGGTYDCLSLVPEDERAPKARIDLNRGGSGFAGSPDGSWAWRGMWSELVATNDVRFAVELFEHHTDLARPARTPAATPRTISYRFVAAVLMAQLGEPGWAVWHDFGGETWTGLPVPSWCPMPRGSWVVYRREEPILALDPESGLMRRSDGATLDLAALYADDRRILRLVSRALVGTSGAA